MNLQMFFCRGVRMENTLSIKHQVKLFGWYSISLSGLLLQVRALSSIMVTLLSVAGLLIYQPEHIRDDFNFHRGLSKIITVNLYMGAAIHINRRCLHVRYILKSEMSFRDNTKNISEDIQTLAAFKETNIEKGISKFCMRS